MTGALAGLKVIDLTRVLGGPYGTQILADHGADVIKLEPPQGDEVREWGPPFHDGDASYFIGINRGKRSVGLDLSKAEGREVLLRLLAGADVLIDNFKPGAMAAWGLGYEEVLAKRFPRLVYCRISGFGADGPLGGFPGYDGIVQGMAGMLSINGDPEGGGVRLGIPIVDIGMGLYSVIAVLMALLERERSGRGQAIDMTLYDSALAMMHPHFANYFLSGRVPGLTGNSHPNISPYDKFRTRTGDIFVGIGNNRAFERFVAALGLEELPKDARFRTNADRVKNRAALTAALAEKLAAIDGLALATELLGLGVPCGPILDSRAALAHPHVAHREMIAEEGWYKGIATPIKLSRTPARKGGKPPRFSEHAREVLSQHGFSQADIERLAGAGVLVEKRRQGGG